MFAVGTALGPCMHYWYQWLDRLYAGRAMKTVTKKVLIDQLIGSPTIWFGFFIGEVVGPPSSLPLFLYTHLCVGTVSQSHTLFFTPIKPTQTKVTR